MTNRQQQTKRPPAKKAAKPADAEAAVLEKIAAMPAPFSALGKRLHALFLRTVPALQPRLWYGMPAYQKDGKTVCFFRADKKWMTFGFTQEADLTLDAAAPHRFIQCAWFFTELDAATEAWLSALIQKVAK